MKRVDLKPGMAPCLQLREQKQKFGKSWSYLPHQGNREKERRRIKLEKAKQKLTEDKEG